jgi:hypothetical protein
MVAMAAGFKKTKAQLLRPDYHKLHFSKMFLDSVTQYD